MKNIIFNGLDKNLFYVFFEEHKRNGHCLNRIFGDGVSSHARFIKKINNLTSPIVNHAGFLFFDNKWKIAELDYFQGGKIIRELGEKEFNNLHWFYILEKKELHLDKIYELFSDKLSKKNWFYSFRRYNFSNGLKLLTSSNSLRRHRNPMRGMIILQLSLLREKSRYNCVDMIFEYCEQFEIKIWDKKKTPYELFHKIRLEHEDKKL